MNNIEVKLNKTGGTKFMVYDGAETIETPLTKLMTTLYLSGFPENFTVKASVFKSLFREFRAIVAHNKQSTNTSMNNKYAVNLIMRADEAMLDLNPHYMVLVEEQYKDEIDTSTMSGGLFSGFGDVDVPIKAIHNTRVLDMQMAKHRYLVYLASLGICEDHFDEEIESIHNHAIFTGNDVLTLFTRAFKVPAYINDCLTDYLSWLYYKCYTNIETTKLVYRTSSNGQININVNFSDISRRDMLRDLLLGKEK